MIAPIILAAGGTGGHIFPAEALAEELNARGERVLLMTDKRFSQYIAGDHFSETLTISAGRMGKGVSGKISGLAKTAWGISQATRTLKRLKPKAVVGFGGYPSFPTVFAAARLGIPTVIHEQNAVLGRANRMLEKRVDVIAASFEHTLMVDKACEDKIIVTGNPVRAAIRALHHLPYPDLQPDGKMQILVTGGSQGAAIFSRIVPAAVAALPAAVRSRLRIDQQCKPEDMDVTHVAYEQLGVSATLSSFFADIPTRIAGSHLVIARSGASTISELAVAGRPAILVPLPTAMDNHQYINANAFEDAGGGWVMAQDGFTAAALSARLESFLSAPQTLSRAAAGARSCGRLDATERLAELVLKGMKKDEEGMRKG